MSPSQACRDFLALAETHSRKWQRALQYEQEQRVHLEETIEQLAKQHNSLERAFRSAPGRASNPTKSFSEGEWARMASVHRAPHPQSPLCQLAQLRQLPYAYPSRPHPACPGQLWLPMCPCIPFAPMMGTENPTVPSGAGLPGNQLATHPTSGLGSWVPWKGGPSEREARPQRN